jgi:nitrite reductase/ring-hydroxylating ferredoxin subunit
MTLHHLGTMDDFPEGSVKIVDVDRKSIGVYNIKGELYALRNRCPHRGAPLCKGLITSYVTSSEPHKFSMEQEGEIVRCPWHQWEFDIKTGQLVVDPRIRTKAYDVIVENGSVKDGFEDNGFVDIGLVADDAVEIAAVEKFDVTVEGRQVYIEIP